MIGGWTIRMAVQPNVLHLVLAIKIEQEKIVLV